MRWMEPPIMRRFKCHRAALKIRYPVELGLSQFPDREDGRR
jgi:hypothetical protein